MRRGDIWTVAGGPDYVGKPRRVVLQHDRFSGLDSVTICPLTTASQEAPLFRISVEPDARNGLSESSWLMVDKIATVRRSKLGERTGRLVNAQVIQLDRAIAVFLRLAA